MSIRKPRSTRAGRVTMQEVARRAGVSAITVSRALRTPDKVAEPVRLRIAQVCQELGYVPNHAASALASALSQTVVVLIPSLSNVVFVDILSGIKEALDAQGYLMLIGVTGYSPEAEENLLRTYLRHAPDGLILTGIDHTPGVWDLLRARQIPTVHTIETLDDGADMSVGFSQFESGYAAGRHLLDCGYRRIAIVGAQLDPRSLRRCEGCRQSLRDAGARSGAGDHDAGEILDRPGGGADGPGAPRASGLRRRVLRQRRPGPGRGVPVRAFGAGRAGPDRAGGFHDLAGSAWTTPPLSTIATPRYEIGLAAAGLLMRHLAGEAIERRHVDLGFELVRRQTT